MPAPNVSNQREIDKLLNAAGEFTISQINALKYLLFNNTGGETQAAYSSGTNYTLTTTAAAVVHGTTSPSITFTRDGTYQLEGFVQLDANGMTVTTQTAALKIRRTNNTPADVTGSDMVYDLPVATTITQTLDTIRMAPVIVTVSAGDTYTLFANINAALGAGTVQVAKSALVATRLY